MNLLVVDVGTSSRPRRGRARRRDRRRTSSDRELLPDSPADGLVEFDAAAHGRGRASTLRRAALAATAARSTRSASPTSAARRSCGTAPPASRSGPALGWQDLRTIGELPRRCAPRASGSRRTSRPPRSQWLLDAVRPRPRRATSASAPSTRGSRGRCRRARVHVTDATNAAVTGLAERRRVGDGTTRVLDALGIPERDAAARSSTPPAIVGRRDRAAGRAADRRARRRPAGVARRPGLRARRADAKITFGTGGMLDVVLGPSAAALRDARRAAARSRSSRGVAAAPTRGALEAVMLAAGTNVRVAARRPRDHRRRRRRVARASPQQCDDTGGVVLRARAARARHARAGTTARAARSSASPAAAAGRRSCGRCSRASPHRGADLVEAAEPDAGITIDVLRVDGGMTRQPDVRAGARRRDAAAGRDLAGARGHHPRRRVPRRARRRAPGPASTTSPPPGRRRARRAGRALRPRPLARRRRPCVQVAPRALRRRLLTNRRADSSKNRLELVRKGGERCADLRVGSP